MAAPLQPKALHDGLLSHVGALLVVHNPVAPPAPAPGQPGAASTYVPATPEIFVAVLCDDGHPSGWRALAFNGHVDLGTGIRTSLAQIVADELEVPFDRLDMVLGHTEAAPNQGPTIASATIQITAVPLRRAAAQAREHLLALAARRWNVPAHTLRARDGAVAFANPGADRRVSYGELLRGLHDLVADPYEVACGQVAQDDSGEFTIFAYPGDRGVGRGAGAGQVFGRQRALRCGHHARFTPRGQHGLQHRHP